MSNLTPQQERKVDIILCHVLTAFCGSAFGAGLCSTILGYQVRASAGVLIIATAGLMACTLWTTLSASAD